MSSFIKILLLVVILTNCGNNGEVSKRQTILPQKVPKISDDQEKIIREQEEHSRAEEERLRRVQQEQEEQLRKRQVLREELEKYKNLLRDSNEHDDISSIRVKITLIENTLASSKVITEQKFNTILNDLNGF